MEPEKTRIIDRIIKLFNLGDAGRNDNEAETMAAVTRAKQLMAEHNIAMAEVAQATSHTHAEQIRVAIEECDAYTIKWSRFATYDNYIAFAVDEICATKNFLRRTRNYTGTFISRRFVGDAVDAAVAAKLFMILLTDMRKAARRRYGSGWSLTHTSYCDGYSSRVWERAQHAPQLTEAQTQCVALVLHRKEEAIDQYFQKIGVRPGRRGRMTRRDGNALAVGRMDGGLVDLGRAKRLA